MEISLYVSPTPSSFAQNNPVELNDWWLIEAEGEFEGKRLGVSGFITRKQVMRVFKSAVIVKRFNAYTLETVDGITIILSGMINKARTRENGFSTEVCDIFLIGFPCNWDYYADEYFQKRSIPPGVCDLDTTQTVGTPYPGCPNGFSIDRICNWLSSVNGNMTEGFRNDLEEFLKSTPVDPMLQTPMTDNLQMANAMNQVDDFPSDYPFNSPLESYREKDQDKGEIGMLNKTPLPSVREMEMTGDLGDCGDIQVPMRSDLNIRSTNLVVTSPKVASQKGFLKQFDVFLSKDELHPEDVVKDHDVEEHIDEGMQTWKNRKKILHSREEKNLLMTHALQHDPSPSGIRTRSGRVLDSTLIVSKSRRSGDVSLGLTGDKFVNKLPDQNMNEAETLVAETPIMETKQNRRNMISRDVAYEIRSPLTRQKAKALNITL